MSKGSAYSFRGSLHDVKISLTQQGDNEMKLFIQIIIIILLCILLKSSTM